MTAPDPKSDLLGCLQDVRDCLLWKLDGLSEYDIRRPLTPTGTNLLGLVKHLTGAESMYFGDAFGRPFDGPPTWIAGGTEPNSDLWATADETREAVVGHYRRACAHSDRTIRELPLDAVGKIPYGPRTEVTLHQILVNMLSETARHVGHADIVRELVDGSVGQRDGGGNTAPGDEAWWRDHRDRVERAAREAGGRAG
jgi:hypothetical protein